jgi:LysM repeat protein
MREFRQVIWGVMAALVSAGILLGSLSMTLIEGGLYNLLNATPTRFVVLVTQPIATILPPRSTVQITTTSELIQDAAPSITNTFDLVSFSPTPRCSPPAGWAVIQVNLGDTLASIAQVYDTTEEILAEANCLEVDTLIAGTELYVPYVYPTEIVAQCGPPPGWVFYTIRPDDTLYSLGRFFGVTVQQLQLANCLGSSTVIRIGQKLYVPYVPTQTPVVDPSDTPQPQPSDTATYTPSATIMITFTPTRVFTATPTSTLVSTQLPAHTSTPTITPTVLPSVTITPTIVPSNTATHTTLPTSTSTNTPVPPTPTATETPLPQTSTSTPKSITP